MRREAVFSLGTDANAEMRAAGWTDASALRGIDGSGGGGGPAAPGGSPRQREGRCECGEAWRDVRAHTPHVSVGVAVVSVSACMCGSLVVQSTDFMGSSCVVGVGAEFPQGSGAKEGNDVSAKDPVSERRRGGRQRIVARRDSEYR